MPTPKLLLLTLAAAVPVALVAHAGPVPAQTPGAQATPTPTPTTTPDQLPEPPAEPPRARLRVRVIVPTDVRAGRASVWRLRARNTSRVADARNVIVKARPSRHLSWVRGGRYNARTRTITFRIRRLDARSRKTFKTVLVANAGGFSSVRARISGKTAP